MAGLKGALISFMPTFIGAIPNVLVFQINPERISHKWTEAGTGRSDAAGGTNFDPLAVTGFPGETFSFTLMLDSNNEIADGATNAVAADLAKVSGAYTRLAALEMTQYPMASASALLGQVSATLRAAGQGATCAPSISVPASERPVVVLAWGPQRILPVLITELNITETLYDELLNPVHAEVQISLEVLTPDKLTAVPGPMRELANIAYIYTQGIRQANATANLAGPVADILGMLPAFF